MQTSAIRLLTVRGRAEGLDSLASALDRVKAAQTGVATASDVLGAATDRSARKQESAAAKWATLQARVDPVARALTGMERELRTATMALDQGVIGADRFAHELERLHRNVEAAGVIALPRLDQSGLHASLGVVVDEVRTSARESAAAFEAEFRRLDEIARLRGEEAGRAFQDGLNRSFNIGGQSAVSGGATFSALEEEARRQDQIEQARRAHAAEVSQRGLNDALGIGRPAISARDSASVFEAEARRIESAAEHASGAWGRLQAMGRANLDLVNRSNLNDEASRRLGNMGAAGQQAAKGAALASHEMGNLAFQINDVATMLAMGQSPLMILASQGGQFVQIFQGAKGGPAAVLKQIGTAALGLLTPVRLLMAGLVGATGAIAWFGSSGSRHVEAVEDAFQRHADTIREIKGLYGEAAHTLKEMAEQSVLVARALAQVNALRMREQVMTKAGEALRSFGSGVDSQATMDPMGSATGFSERPLFDVSARYAQFREQIEALQKSYAEGTPDVLAFQDAVSSKMVGGMREAVEAGQELLDKTKEVADAARKLPSALESAAGAFKSVIGTKEWEGFLIQQAGSYRDMKAGWEEAESRAATSYGFDVRAIAARTVEQRAAVAADRARAEALQDASTAAYADAAAQRAAGRVYAEATEQARAAAQERALAQGERLASAALDLRSVDLPIVEAERLRIILDRTNDARREALALTRSDRLSAERVRQINDEADALSGLSQKLREANLARDIANDRRRLFMSDRDASIDRDLEQAGLRQNGLNTEAGARQVDYGGAKVAVADLYAEQLRVNDALREMKDIGRDAWSTLTEGVMNGEGALKSAAKAGRSLLRNLTKRSLDTVYENAWSALGDAMPGLKELGLGGKPDGSRARPFHVIMGGAGGAEGLLGKAANDLVGAKLSGSGDVTSAPLPRLLSTEANDNRPAPNAAPFAAAVSRAAGAGGGDLSFVGNYRRGVDPRLTEILNEAASRSGYKVEAFSGFRPGDPRFHGKGLATDVRLLDQATGKPLPNYQNAESFRAYEQFAQEARTVQMERYPGLADDFRWGGYFGGGRGKYGAMDTMHFDLGGRRVGMGGGSWEEGLSPTQRRLWPGARSQGMGTRLPEERVSGSLLTGGAGSNMLTGASAANDNLTALAQTAGTASSGLDTFGTNASGLANNLLAPSGALGDATSKLSASSGLLASSTDQAANASQGFAGGLAGGLGNILTGIGQVGSSFLGGLGNVFTSLIGAIGGMGGGAAGGGGGAGGLLSIVGSLFGFEEGGYTGPYGTGQVAGVVHGQEFVAHAEATRRWRPMLERMNAGLEPFPATGALLRASRDIDLPRLHQPQLGMTERPRPYVPPPYVPPVREGSSVTTVKSVVKVEFDDPMFRSRVIETSTPVAERESARSGMQSVRISDSRVEENRRRIERHGHAR